MHEYEGDLLSVEELLTQGIMPPTIEKLTVRDFYHNVQLLNRFNQLKEIVLYIGTPSNAAGGQAPAERAFYD